MVHSFNCPNCSAPLDFDGDDIAVRCPYCNSSVIVPNQTAPATPKSSGSALPVVGLDTLIGQANTLKEIAQLIKSGNRTEAINLYRETFDTSLAEAQAAVEKLASGRGVVMPASTSAARTDLERRLSRLLKEGNQIEAIKLYRETYPQVGLKEAKDAVEKYDTSGLLDAPDGTVSTTETANLTSGLSSDRAAAARADIARLMREGKKIEAIKVYRQVTGSGLKEAKDSVEAFESGGVLNFTSIIASPADEAAAVKGLAQTEIERLARAGNKIEAIKLYRTATGAGLKEARDAIEGFLAGRPLSLKKVVKPEAIFDQATKDKEATTGLPLRYQFLLFAGMSAILFLFLTIFVWPNQLRIGAPFLCPSGYDNAYGLKTNGFVELHCYVEPNRDVAANTVIALAAVFVFYFLVGAFLFVILKYISFAGVNIAVLMVLPLSTLSFPLIAWATSAEAPQGMFALGLLFADTDGVRIEPSFTEQLLTRFNYATPVLYIGTEGSRPGYFKSIQSVAVAGDGTIYGADYNGDSSTYRIQVFDATGQYVSEWSTGDSSIDSIVADENGRLYVAGGDGVAVYSGQSGELIRTLDGERLYRDLSWDAAGGLVGVTLNEVVWLDPTTGVKQSSETFQELVGEELFSANLAVGPDGRVYVGDDENYQILVFATNGQLLSKFGSKGDAIDQFEYSPGAMFVDSQNQLYVDVGSDLKVFDSNGIFLRTIDLAVSPSAMFLTATGELWVANGYAEQIVKFRVNQ